MSDGNFNRALLPHTPYQSGMQAGKSMTRMHATDVFKALLQKHFPTLSEEELHTLTNEFRTTLSKKL